MIRHLLQHPVALIHVVAAVLALAAGLGVLLRRKGTRRHRQAGRVYVAAMLVLNVSALFDYELYGRFGPFHWLALASLATVAAGYVAVRRRLYGWPVRHAHFMAGSYVGLVAAAVAEAASRVPGWPFAPSVLLSSLVVIAAGLVIMIRRVPASLRRAAAPARARDTGR